MSFVSYKTAVRLKEAGFPQPEFDFRQVWYAKNDADGKLGLVPIPCCAWQGEHPFLVDVDGQVVYLSDIPAPDLVFAPTATEILRELPGVKLWFYPDQGFVCYNIVNNQDKWIEMDNPAEACAAAWLAIHEKK